MKKAAVWFAALFFIVVCLCFAASAHTGGTDSHGGHYVGGSGEYHYHHGYSAHQHINGACPYDFDDKTGDNSGSSGNAKTKQQDKPATTHSTEETKSDEKKPGKLTITVCLAFLGTFLGAPLAFGLVFQFFFWIWVLLGFEKRRERKKAVKHYSGKSVAELANVPNPYQMDFNNDVFINGQHIETEKILCVYATMNGTTYHAPTCKYIANKKTVELLLSKASRLKLKKCHVCNTNGTFPEWYKEYVRINEIRKKYGIDMKP